jgi:hypothetical protein
VLVDCIGVADIARAQSLDITAHHWSRPVTLARQVPRMAGYSA